MKTDIPLLVYFFVALAAGQFAIADLWARGAHFSAIFLLVTMLVGFVLLFLRAAESSSLRQQLDKVTRERDELRDALNR